MNTSVSRAQKLLQFVAVDPDNFQLLAELADIQIDIGDLVAARTHVHHALTLTPESDEFLYRRAIIDRHSGELTQAKDTLLGLHARHPGQPAIAIELGCVLYTSGEYEKVLPVLNSIARGTIPSQLEATEAVLRVRTFHAIGDEDEAIALAKEWLEAHPDAHYMVGALATLYLDTGRTADARPLLDRGGVANAELLTVGAFLDLEESNATQAIARFEESVRLDPNLGRSHLGLGLAIASQGNLPLGIEYLRNAVALMPGNPASWHALAWLQLMSKDIDGASSSFEHAVQANHNFGESHGGRAIIAALRGQQQQAREHIRVARALGQTSVNADMAETLLETGAAPDSPLFFERGMQALNRGVLGNDAALARRIQTMLFRQSRRPGSR